MYTLLTGCKNNAGDFLIKYRAKQLLKKIRPERDLVDFDAWEPFDQKKLNVVNKSKALILLGGPSLQYSMRPSIYKMTTNLDDINIPIISMGIGWKSIQGNWSDTYNYKLNKETLLLLDRINKSGYLSSVRDYHTLNTLNIKGFKNFCMTGCPAYYDYDFFGKPLEALRIKKIAFSLGVSFINSKSMEALMKKNIIECKNFMEGYEFEVVFHHTLDYNKYLSVYDSKPHHVLKHIEFSKWLTSKGISYVDISGSAENLIEYYKNIDLHIGYRVHAHVFMNSISKFSILISEDGRAKGVKYVIGGIVLNGYVNFQNSYLIKLINKFLFNYDKYTSNLNVTKEIISNIIYEQKFNFNQLKNSRNMIDNNYQIMKTFISQLP